MRVSRAGTPVVVRERAHPTLTDFWLFAKYGTA
jgi:hypothetical protein